MQNREQELIQELLKRELEERQKNLSSSPVSLKENTINELTSKLPDQTGLFKAFLDNKFKNMKDNKGLLNFSFPNIPENLAMIAGSILPETKAVSWLGKGASSLSGIQKYIANYLGNIGKGALGGATTNALMPSDDNQSFQDKAMQGAEFGGGASAVLSPYLALLGSRNPLTRISAAVPAGVAAGYYAGNETGTPKTGEGLGGVLALYLASRGKGLNDAALLNTLGRHNPEQMQAAIARKQAGENAGIPLNMLEALGTPKAGSMLSKLGSTPESSDIMYKFGEQRATQEPKAIDEMINLVSPPNAYKELEEPLYKSAENKNPIVDYKPAVDLLNREIGKSKGLVRNSLKSALNLMKKDSDQPINDTIKINGSNILPQDINPQILSQLGKVDNFDNTLNGLHATKEGIDALMANRGDSTSVDRVTKAKLNKVKNVLLEKMDQASPEYANARRISELRINADNLRKAMADSEKTGSNFYDKILRNDDEYKKLHYAIRDKQNPKQESIAQKKLRAMKESSKYLIEPITGKVAAMQAEKGTPKIKGVQDALMEGANNLVFGKYHKAIAQLITSPTWDKEVERISELKNGSARGFAFANLLTKIANAGELSEQNQQTTQGGM